MRGIAIISSSDALFSNISEEVTIENLVGENVLGNEAAHSVAAVSVWETPEVTSA